MKTLFSILLLFIAYSVNANECLNLQSALKDNTFWTMPTENYIDYGFLPAYEWNEDEKQNNYAVDDNGLIINQIYPESPSYDVALLGMFDENITNLVNENIRITHINLKEIKSLSEDELNKIFTSNLIGEKIVLTTLNIETNVSLKKTLKSDYISSPPKVIIDFWIDDLINVDAKNMEYTAKYYLNYYWTDNRWFEIVKQAGLGQEGNAYRCVFKNENFDLNEYQYWQPLLYFSNKVSAVNTSYNKPTRDDLIIEIDEYDEVIFKRVMEETVIFNAEMIFRDFPFDKHEIFFEITSDDWEYYILKPDEGTQIMADYFLSRIVVPEWKTKDINFYDYVDYYEDGSPYHSYIYSIFIERDYQYYIYKLIIPIFIIMIICWSVFWIRAKEIETRLTVTVVSFLTLIAYNFVIVNDIPKVGTFTIFDTIILLAYIYAAMGTLLSIYSYSKYEDQALEFSDIDYYARYIGPISYFVVLSFIVLTLYNKYISVASYLGLF